MSAAMPLETWHVSTQADFHESVRQAAHKLSLRGYRPTYPAIAKVLGVTRHRVETAICKMRQTNRWPYSEHRQPMSREEVNARIATQPPERYTARTIEAVPEFPRLGPTQPLETPEQMAMILCGRKVEAEDE